MIGRKTLAVAMGLMLSGLVSAATAHAKACPALCKDQIKACKALCTTKPKAACKHLCKKHFVDECKATAQKAKDRTCPASPSGAFLN